MSFTPTTTIFTLKTLMLGFTSCTMYKFGEMAILCSVLAALQV